VVYGGGEGTLLEDVSRMIGDHDPGVHVAPEA